MISKYEREELELIEKEYNEANIKENEAKSRSRKFWKPWTWSWWELLLWLTLAIVLRFVVVMG